MWRKMSLSRTMLAAVFALSLGAGCSESEQGLPSSPLSEIQAADPSLPEDVGTMNPMVADYEGISPDDSTTQTVWTEGELAMAAELGEFSDDPDMLGGLNDYPGPITDFKWPVRSGEQVKITCGYGCGKHQGSEYHAVDLINGRDANGTRGMWVENAAYGKVVGVGYSPTRGNYVIIDHVNRRTMYYHLDHDSRAFLRAQTPDYPGDILMRGTYIGCMGQTGNATGPHLHFVLQQISGGTWSSIPINGIDDDWDIRQGSTYTSSNAYVAPPRGHQPGC